MMTEIRESQTVLVPKGERYETFAAAAYEEFDVDFPTFPDGVDVVAFEGREYKQVDDTEIPELISEGYGDIGFTGLDTCTESDADVEYRSFGQPFAYFDLVASKGTIEKAKALLASESEDIPVATNYPKLLGSGAVRKNINLVPVEGKSDLSLSTAVIPANVEVENVMRLRELRPTVVWKATK